MMAGTIPAIISGLAPNRGISCGAVRDIPNERVRFLTRAEIWRFNIDRRKIQLHEPLKTLGEFTVPIKLHKDVTTHLKVVVEKEAVE